MLWFNFSRKENPLSEHAVEMKMMKKKRRMTVTQETRWWYVHLPQSLVVWFWSVSQLVSFSGCNPQSAEDVIAQQAKQQEDDPYANLSKKEKKKKKKMVCGNIQSQIVIRSYNGCMWYLGQSACDSWDMIHMLLWWGTEAGCDLPQ